ncbi:MAG TPA: class I SAM-dependent methyltransferase [Polyangiaceae bacterium]
MLKLLNSMQELEDARSWLRERGVDFTQPSKAWIWRLLFTLRFRTPALPADKLKSWDVASMVQLIEKLAPDRSSPILDLGCFNSEILWSLRDIGYRELYGCDLNPLCKWMPYWTSVRYTTGDMTRTDYSSGKFQVLTAVSAIEHGVPIAALAREASRLLRPGGIFLLTTDYDGSAAKHDTSGELIFEQAWTIFSASGLQSVVEEFRANGLELLNEVAEAEWNHDARPVTWNGQEYTFALLAFRRTGGS